MTEPRRSPLGESLEDFLTETGDRDAVYGAAIKEVLAWQLEEARKASDLSKTAMAEAMRSSRTQVDRVLDPQNVAVSLEVLDRAARAVGKRLRIELEDAVDVVPIRTDEDHAKALAEIDRLWGAEPGTPDGERLNVLLTLVHAYEEANHPIPPSDPSWIDPDDAPDLSTPEWQVKFAKARRGRLRGG